MLIKVATGNTSLTNVSEDCCKELEVFGVSEVEEGPWAQKDNSYGLREEEIP